MAAAFSVLMFVAQTGGGDRKIVDRTGMSAVAWNRFEPMFSCQKARVSVTFPGEIAMRIHSVGVLSLGLLSAIMYAGMGLVVGFMLAAIVLFGGCDPEPRGGKGCSPEPNFRNPRRRLLPNFVCPGGLDRRNYLCGIVQLCRGNNRRLRDRDRQVSAQPSL